MVVSIATRPRTSGTPQSATSQENHPVRGEEEGGGGGGGGGQDGTKRVRLICIHVHVGQG